MPWTDEMVEELKRLWDEGVTTGEIGRRLNISKNSIVGKVHRLGLSGRPSPIKKKSPAGSAPSDSQTPKKKPASPKTSTPKETQPAKKPEKESSPRPQSEPKPQPKPQPQAKPKPETVSAKPADTFSATEEDIKLAKSLNIPTVNQSNKEFLSLTDLDNHTCRWPIGNTKNDNFHFCGKKVRLGQTSCEEHAAVAYVKKKKK